MVPRRCVKSMLAQTFADTFPKSPASYPSVTLGCQTGFPLQILPRQM